MRSARRVHEARKYPNTQAMLGMPVNIVPRQPTVSAKTSGSSSMVKAMPPSTLRLKPVAVTMMSASRCRPTLGLDAGLGERLDLVGHHRGVTVGDRLEQVAIGDEGDALAPRPVAGGEVRIGVVVVAEVLLDPLEQLGLHHLGMLG